MGRSLTHLHAIVNRLDYSRGVDAYAPFDDFAEDDVIGALESLKLHNKWSERPSVTLPLLLEGDSICTDARPPTFDCNNILSFKHLGSTIKASRKLKDMTQTELSDKLRISARYLKSIENSGQIPSIKLLERLINELEIPADMVFYS
jgi:DNA-binding XRE family transcriptional regulator